MATVIPAPDNSGALSFLLGMQRLAEEKRQFDTSQQNEQQRLALQKQGTALAILNELKTSIPKGTPISAATALHAPLKALGVDWTQLKNADGSEAIINPMSGEDMIDEQTKKLLIDAQQHPEGAPPWLPTALSSAYIRKISGIAATPTQFSAAEKKAGIESRGLDAFDTATKTDPGLLYKIAAKDLGLPDEVTFQYGGRTYKFESEAAGRLALGFAQLAQERDLQTASLGIQAGSVSKNLIYQLSKDTRDSLEKQGIHYTAAQVYRVVEAEANGKLNELVDPSSKFYQPDLAPLGQIIRTSAMAAPGMAKLQMQLSPGGQFITNFQNLLESFDGVPPEIKADLLASATKKLRDSGIRVPAITTKRGMAGFGKIKGATTEFSEPGTEGQPKHGNKQDFQSLENLNVDQLESVIIQNATQLFQSKAEGYKTTADLQKKGFSAEQIQRIVRGAQ
jgi:hypothetical protein